MIMAFPGNLARSELSELSITLSDSWIGSCQLLPEAESRPTADPGSESSADPGGVPQAKPTRMTRIAVTRICRNAPY